MYKSMLNAHGWEINKCFISKIAEIVLHAVT